MRNIDVRPLEEKPRTTGELMRAVAGDTADLIRKEIELAKQELREGVQSIVRMAAAMAGAAVLALIALIMLALAMSDALGTVMPVWAARLATAGIVLGLAAAAVGAGVAVVRKSSLMPTETARTIKEDVEWAKQQLKR